MEYINAILAFERKMRPFYPLAASGVKAAQQILEGGMSAIQKQWSEGRAPTEAEWAALKDRRTELLRKLNSDID